MKLKEDNIDIYNNSAIILQGTESPFINSWIIILIILSLLFILISFIPFNIYNTYNGYIIDDYIYINEYDFPVNKSNKLYINKDNYKYEVVSIDNENVVLKVKIKDDIKINNNIVVVNILKDRITIFKIIKNKIKKGFDVWKI